MNVEIYKMMIVACNPPLNDDNERTRDELGENANILNIGVLNTSRGKS